MRLATNGIPLQCSAPLHFSILNQFRPLSLGNPPMASLRCLTCGRLSASYFPLPALKVLCLLIIPTLQITLESNLDLMLPFSHLSPVLHPLATGFLESHCGNGSIKISVFKLIKSFKCLYSIFSLVLTTSFYILSPTLARRCL